MNDKLGELAERQTKTESQIEALTNDVRSLASSVQSLADSINRGRQTNWGVIFAGMTALLAVVVLYVAPFAQGQHELKSLVKDSRYLFLEHVRDGHPGRVEDKVKANTDRIEDLRRELREYAGLRERAIAKEIDAMRHRLSTVEVWQRENNVSSAERHARAEALIGVNPWSPKMTKN